MRTIDSLLSEYGESHQNEVNKNIHWICVPLIMCSLVGLLMLIPMPFQYAWYSNWATLVLLFVLLYYFRLSVAMFFGFSITAFLLLYMNGLVIQYCHASKVPALMIFVWVFAGAWMGQFYGHKIEGKKPSFLKDVQFLLIGPAWLMHFIYNRLGIKY